MGAKPNAVELAVVGLSVRGAVIALDAARWRLRLASLEPDKGGPERFAFSGAEAIDAELARQAAAMLDKLRAIDPAEAAEVEAERERCDLTRRGLFRSSVTHAEVYVNGGGR